jgi:ABC-type bacteriocin/lantibiotic exporter with double-glycine peptidase domain
MGARIDGILSLSTPHIIRCVTDLMFVETIVDKLTVISLGICENLLVTIIWTS